LPSALGPGWQGQVVRVFVLRPTSRVSARARIHPFFNTVAALSRMGNREWGLRPPTQTTCPRSDV